MREQAKPAGSQYILSKAILCALLMLMAALAACSLRPGQEAGSGAPAPTCEATGTDAYCPIPMATDAEPACTLVSDAWSDAEATAYCAVTPTPTSTPTAASEAAAPLDPKADACELGPNNPDVYCRTIGSFHILLQ
jgi:hypothetical protein